MSGHVIGNVSILSGKKYIRFCTCYSCTSYNSTPEGELYISFQLSSEAALINTRLYHFHYVLFYLVP